MQTLSLKKTLQLTTIGYLFNGKIYTDKIEFLDAKKRFDNTKKFNTIVEDIKNVITAANLESKLIAAKTELKKCWSFIKYCTLLTCKKILANFKNKLDKFTKKLLF